MTDALTKEIKAVYCPERPNSEVPGATVGYGDVTEIRKTVENLGTYGIAWYDVYKSGKLAYSINALQVETVYYDD